MTLKGKRHTETALEQALEIDKPALPLPFTGDDSECFWHAYKSRIQKWFPALDHERVRQLETFQLTAETTSEEIGAIIDLIVDVLASAKFKCLVLMPYDAEHDAAYAQVIEPAVSDEMIADRLAQTDSADTISNNFASSVDTALAIIADVTTRNRTVMYELGYARAKGIDPFLFSRRPLNIETLPIYLRNQNVRILLQEDELQAAIRSYLRHMRHTMRRA